MGTTKAALYYFNARAKLGVLGVAAQPRFLTKIVGSSILISPFASLVRFQPLLRIPIKSIFLTASSGAIVAGAPLRERLPGLHPQSIINYFSMDCPLPG